MHRFLKALFGRTNCVSCGKDLSFTWSRNVNRHHFLTNQHGRRKISFKASIHVEGICLDCFEPKAAEAMKRVEAAFNDLIPQSTLEVE